MATSYASNWWRAYPKYPKRCQKFLSFKALSLSGQTNVHAEPLWSQFARPPVRPSVTKLVNTLLWKRTPINTSGPRGNLQGHETINFGGQKVKGQDHTGPQMDLGPGWGIILSTSMGRV